MGRVTDQNAPYRIIREAHEDRFANMNTFLGGFRAINDAGKAYGIWWTENALQARRWKKWQQALRIAGAMPVKCRVVNRKGETIIYDERNGTWKLDPEYS